MQWNVYLADGSSFSNEDGEPYDVPLSGIVAIAQADDVVGHTVTVGFNYYYFRDGEWWGCYDSAAMLLEVCTDMTGEIKTVRAGKTVSNKMFNDIRVRARREHEGAYKLIQPDHAIRYSNDG